MHSKHSQEEKYRHTDCRLQTAIQSPKGQKIAPYDYCSISFLLFCCDGCLLSFYVFHFNCQSVSRKQEGWWACAADPDSPGTKGELVRELGLSSIHSYSHPSLCLVLFPHSLFSPLTFLNGCECDARNHFSRKQMAILGSFWRSTVWTLSSPCVHSAEECLSKMLNHCQLTEPLILTSAFSGWGQMKRQIPLMHQSLQRGSAFDWAVPLSLEAATCLDEPVARCFWPVCALVVVVISRTSLAPACFASITIYQATRKAEGSPLAPRPECVKQQRRAEVDGADSNAGLSLG